MSDDLKDFARPVLRGPRFDDHAIPVELLKEFDKYRDAHAAMDSPSRSETPTHWPSVVTWNTISRVHGGLPSAQ